jgi:hypothetical protein
VSTRRPCGAGHLGFSLRGLSLFLVFQDSLFSLFGSATGK